MTTPPFEKFIKNPFPGRLITFDPGETTGYSIWDNCKLTDYGQLNTQTVKDVANWLKEWIDMHMAQFPDLSYCKPYKVVIEEYRVYSHLAQSHAQDTMHTSRLIGCLETLLTLRGIEYEMCGAGVAKNFATDQKLKDWGFYTKAQRHGNDAIRHGVYYLCKEPKKP